MNTLNWKRFHLYDNQLFNICHGNKFDKCKMSTSNPTINFIGRSNINNGITYVVDKINNIEPYKKGYITLALGGSLGSCFIQEDDFYTSRSVDVLIPKWDMSLNIKLFIATIIFKESTTYYRAFDDELNRHIMTDFSIMLPVDKNNIPDWNYMNNYMSNIMNKTYDKIAQLKRFNNI